MSSTGSGPSYKNFLLLLFFLSGLSALVYEVLWLKELKRLFGSTAYATSTTLAVFFLGLAVGGYFWGKKVIGAKNPLRLYAYLELGIAAAALLYFLILRVYFLIYPQIFAAFDQNPIALTASRFFLSISLLFPASFLIGGTLPVIGQVFITKNERLGKTGSLLYGINTLGAALGALIAGFLLPPLLGIKLSYIMAVAINVFIGLIAYRLSGSLLAKKRPENAGQKFPKKENIGAIYFFSFASGFITLGLEVLWIQMFAQVFLNDVYSFSLIVAAFIAALALGAYLARILINIKTDQWKLIYYLFLVSGALITSASFLFFKITDALSSPPFVGSWTNYLFSLFVLASLIILPPTIFMGAIFPYLLKTMERQNLKAGESIGTLVSLNTFGAITGSLVVGFVFLRLFGLWRSIGFMSALYFSLSIIAGSFFQKQKNFTFTITLVLTFVFSFLLTQNLSSVSLNSENNEKLLEVWQGKDGVVSVISAQPPHYPQGLKEDLFIRLNNKYTLGGVGSLPDERRQAHLPLILHNNPKTVFFLGMATGISAGASLYHPVERVVVTELIPEVAEAAKKYFGQYNNGLFADSRAQIVIEDGRNYLSATNMSFDVIISDLFRPWDSGTGDLYTQEHFKTVYSRLNEDGIFALWLPLYQISEKEFGVIAQTIVKVFPQVTIWRGNFVADKPTVALVAYKDPSPIYPKTIQKNLKEFSDSDETDEAVIDYLVSTRGLSQLAIDPGSREFLVELLPQLKQKIPYTFYLGNISESKDLFVGYPFNTDDKPVFEYLAPKTAASENVLENPWLNLQNLAEFNKRFSSSLPPENDPYLSNLESKQIEYVMAGQVYFEALVNSYEGYLINDSQKLERSKELLNEYYEKLNLTDPFI